MTPTLHDLREDYVRRANEALAEDRMNLVRELEDEYVEEALLVLLTTA